MFKKRVMTTERSERSTTFVTRLCSAVQMQDKEEIRSILVHTEGDQDSILLAFTTAVQNGDPEIVRIFIETGHIHIDVLDLMFGETALMHSVRNGHLSLVKYLLQNNASINKKSAQNGVTALHVCVSGPEKPHNNLEILDYLLHNDTIDLEARDNGGETPVMKASSQLKSAEIKRLLDAGCDVHAVHVRRGQSPIHFCLLSEYFAQYPSVVAECFRLFLEYGIDPNFKDQHGVPLVGYAIKFNKYHILCLLLYVNCDIDIIYREKPTHSFNTPLYYACQRKELRLIKTLMEAGCGFHYYYDTIRQTLNEITHGKYNISNSPRNLKELCRVRIRSVLGLYPHKIVDKLGLPKIIQDYIMLKDVIGNIEF